MASTFNVGDLVRHRASGERGVVVELVVDGKGKLVGDAILSTGFESDGYNEKCVRTRCIVIELDSPVAVEAPK